MDTSDTSQILDDITGALRALLQGGLPTTEERATDRLLDLKGVIARAANPADKLSRVKALNTLLVQQITAIPPRRERDLASAAVILFGLTKPSKRWNQTLRMQEAAKQIGYSDDHFRQEIIPKILRQLARQLHQDSESYSLLTRPPNEITGDAPSILQEHLASRERAEREERISRLWEYVYGLRAELIVIQRIKAWPDEENAFLKLEEARESTLWYLSRLFVSIQEYVELYGMSIMKGDAEHNVEGLIRLAGWTGELPKELAYKVRLLAAREPTKEGFLKAARDAGIFITAVGDY
jgi:hypothetical protein